ncbi:MAG: hypothetical protein KatS3mg129_0375 [Leptospiraceae bacterium]|nr:MAG: hypothetical protein KatS3mg129_0375 [Leptospiraceae bacterium]
MKKFKIYIILLSGGMICFQNQLIAQETQETIEKEKPIIQQENQDHNESNLIKENSQETEHILDEEQQISKEEILKKAKIYQCIINNQQEFQIAILDSGEAYLFFNHSYKKIPIQEEINPEEIHIICKDQKLIFESKKPLSNITHRQIFSVKQNKDLEFIGSSQHDSINNYIDELFQSVLEGNKNRILQTDLKEIPFAYQYINSEKLSFYMNKILNLNYNKNFRKKIKIYESYGILTTKLIYYYHLNLNPEKEILEDFKNWIYAWEHIGLDNYESFILEYGKTLLNINQESGNNVLNYLIIKKPDYIPAYTTLGDYYWNINQKEKAKEFYNKIIEIEKNKEQQEKMFLNDDNNSSNIPEYIYERIKE